MDTMQRIPFFRLLLPLLAGIVVQYYFDMCTWGVIPLFIGLSVMLFSYFIAPKKQFDLRWLFGLGAFIFLFCLGVFSTGIRQQISNFSFPDAHQTYRVRVIDIPQDKPMSTAYTVELIDNKKKIICYFNNDASIPKLDVGDCFEFFAKVQAFESIPSAGEFDYAHYMYTKGYAGFVFVPSDRWEHIQNTSFRVDVEAVKCRQAILSLYQSLDLGTDGYAMFAALTLGYTGDLSEDIVSSFRVAGTTHVLAVSGMHVAIIYFSILFLLGFMPHGRVFERLKLILVLVLLWVYVFLIGLPPSAVRAGFMLSLYCIAQLVGLKAYSYNTFFATAFLMLVWNPFQLFDIGFQLSFVAVFSMLVLMPLFSRRFSVKNKVINYFVSIASISVIAQLGVFPLCLYYFGAFPSYFFATNLLIIPLVTVAMYVSLAIGLIAILCVLVPPLYAIVMPLCTPFYEFIVQLILRITSFFQDLPLAQVENVKISLSSVFLIWILTASLFFFVVYKQSRALIVVLSCSLLLIFTGIYSRIDERNSLTIYRKPRTVFLTYWIGYNRFDINELDTNKLIWLNSKKYILLVQDTWKESVTTSKFDVDYLHLAHDNAISMYSLSQKFNIKRVILDSSLSTKSQKRLIHECEKLRIPYYDVAKNGTLRIFF
ncbi:MAG: hypothetical protein RL662_2161 [Bacteroidota bacterium]|jgi:competence protein ComEC